MEQIISENQGIRGFFRFKSNFLILVQKGH
jgi:hypothetical protein